MELETEPPSPAPLGTSEETEELLQEFEKLSCDNGIPFEHKRRRIELQHELPQELQQSELRREFEKGEKLLPVPEEQIEGIFAEKNARRLALLQQIVSDDEYIELQSEQRSHSGQIGELQMKRAEVQVLEKMEAELLHKLQQSEQRSKRLLQLRDLACKLGEKASLAELRQAQPVAERTDAARLNSSWARPSA